MNLKSEWRNNAVPKASFRNGGTSNEVAEVSVEAEGVRRRITTRGYLEIEDRER